MTKQPLTPDQISYLKENGYLILRNFIDPLQVQTWRHQFWQHLDADADDPSTWPDSYVIEGFSTDPIMGHLPQISAVVEQLGGGQFNGGGGSMLVQWPKQDQDWNLSNSGHIDGYGPGGWSGGFMLGATTYLHDIEHRGGGFLYWPQSHLSTHDYFLEFPAHIDGSFTEREDWEERTWRVFSDKAPQTPVEFTGRAGDVIFWHCFLCHTGSPNVLSVARTGVFSRWHHADKEQMRYDIPEDLWKYWNI
jgi:hypothetical protein